MNKLVFTQEPPPHWNELCSRHGDLFNTPEWHRVLSDGFGSETLYGWDVAASTGLSITVFKAGPFRIGYLGFPVGGTIGNGAITSAILADLKSAHFPTKLHCIRMPMSVFGSYADLPLPSHTTPETAIECLQAWNPEELKKVRRIINKKERSHLRITEASESLQGAFIFHLYRETIDRHQGSMRYTEGYFQALVDFSAKHPGLRCLVATLDTLIVGFLVIACQGKVAYYLHGGINHDFKRYYPSDMLFLEAISWAKKQGMEQFNMMASPLNQKSLVRYKEKWGGVTRPQQTYELALSPFMGALFSEIYKKIDHVFPRYLWRVFA